MNSAYGATPPEFLKLLAHDIRWQLLARLGHGDLRVQELADLVGKPINLVSYHLKRLRAQAVVREHRSSADGRDVYYSLDLERLGVLYRQAGAQLHPALDWGALRHSSRQRLAAASCSGANALAAPEALAPLTLMPAYRVLFLCTHNSSRSQMAEGILRHLSQGQVDVYSAGSTPGDVHPLAVQALAGLGINGSGQRAKHMDIYSGEHFDFVITVCDQVREQCPVFGGQPDCIHWSIADPVAAAARAATAAERHALFAATAQELERRIRQFLEALAVRT